jgi:hypothetical protein
MSSNDDIAGEGPSAAVEFDREPFAYAGSKIAVELAQAD